jgi:2-keto-4-pentenoate hydratase/2-oxohepta-3-ene-1,7-dioic acid hydratase in catechol pathway
MMRLATIDGRLVLVDGVLATDVEKASGSRFAADPLAVLDRWDEFRAWAETATTADGEPFTPERLGPPVPRPRQVFALALNYRDHAAEAGIPAPEHPLVFTKFPTCISGPRGDIALPSDRVDWEVELVVVVGRRASHVDPTEAWRHVAGLTVGQDVSERRVQFRKPHPHFATAKSFPTFGPTGPVLVTPDELADPDDLAIRCSVNGDTMQDSRTGQLIFDVPALVSFLSSTLTLLPGDLIFTGTPEGVGSTRDPRLYLRPGDVVESEIEGIGTLRNVCVAAERQL